jgi:hypothetical protein
MIIKFGSNQKKRRELQRSQLYVVSIVVEFGRLAKWLHGTQQK